MAVEAFENYLKPATESSRGEEGEEILVSSLAAKNQQTWQLYAHQMRNSFQVSAVCLKFR